MKSSYIEVSAPANYHDKLIQLGNGTSLSPLKSHFFASTGRLYIRVPEDMPEGKFICAAQDRGFADAKPATSFTVLDND